MNALRAVFLGSVVLVAIFANRGALGRTVGFEALTVGTRYGSVFGNAAGDLILTENQIAVRLREFTHGSGGSTAFGTATVGGFTAPVFTSTPMTLSNISLEFDLTGLGVGLEPMPFRGWTRQATFEFADFGGTENFGIDGVLVVTPRLDLLPPTLSGVQVFVQPPSLNLQRGNVTLVGQFQRITIGGQEFGIDNLVVYDSIGECFSDANNDCRVDLLDLDILGANFGLTQGATIAQGDFNGDGAVDLLDLDILGANFQSGPALAVPEPAALSLFAVALSAFTTWRISRSP